MTLPNFLFVGADKAGSTWLFHVLQSHPDVFVPAAKDVYFFDRYYDRGLDWYSGLFAKAPADARAVGELSHDYLYSDAAASRIRETLPGVRIVMFLRHPVERTFSEYLYLRRSGLIRDESVRDALARYPEAVDHSRYATHVPRYLDRFPRENIGVFFFDDLQRDPRALGGAVLEFLGVGALPEIDYERRVLEAARPRSAFAARALRGAATATRSLGLPGLVGRVKTSPLTRLAYASYEPNERPRLSTEDRRWLHEELDPDVRRLEQLLGVNLAHWLARPDSRGFGDSTPQTGQQDRAEP